MNRLIALLAIVCVTLLPVEFATASTTDTCPEKAGWNDPARPAHIFGNTWYVGTCAISAILITSPEGHVLLDGATEKAAPSIEANIRALGFKVEDVKFILILHEHMDHAGGIARLKKDSGATVVAREPAAIVLERGTNDRSDPQFGTLDDFPPVKKVQRIQTGESIALGGTIVTAHATPAHTTGSTSWTWTSCESGECRNMVYADSLTAVSADGYRFSDKNAHPGEVAKFRKSFKVVAEMPCDILMTPHPRASDLLARLGPGGTEAIADQSACAWYAEAAGQYLDARLAKEAANSNP